MTVTIDSLLRPGPGAVALLTDRLSIAEAVLERREATASRRRQERDRATPGTSARRIAQAMLELDDAVATCVRRDRDLLAAELEALR